MYMNIHSNGDVDCCGCVYPPLYIGNIYQKSLSEIWNGDRHKQVMIKHLTCNRKEIPVCASCESIEKQNGFEEDDLNPYLDEILERVKRL